MKRLRRRNKPLCQCGCGGRVKKNWNNKSWNKFIDGHQNKGKNMRRLKRKKSKEEPSAILCADLHLREDTPRCRTDNFWIGQDKKINFIFNLAKQYNIPIFVSGDLGHKPRWSCRLLEWFISKVGEDIKIFGIHGQHDLINHNLDLWESSGVGVLHAANTITLLGPQHSLQSDWEFDDFHLNVFPYGKNIHHVKPSNSSKPQVAITHQMVIKNKPLWPGQEAPKGHQLLKKYPEYNLILSGDNHNPFIAEYKGRVLVNPGSMMRSTADQINHKPRVYLWYAKTNKVKKVYLPIKKGVVSREHIEQEEERDERIGAYVKHIKTDYEIGFSFEKNCERHIEKNKTEKEVEDKLWRMVV